MTGRPLSHWVSGCGDGAGLAAGVISGLAAGLVVLTMGGTVISVEPVDADVLGFAGSWLLDALLDAVGAGQPSVLADNKATMSQNRWRRRVSVMGGLRVSAQFSSSSRILKPFGCAMRVRVDCG